MSKATMVKGDSVVARGLALAGAFTRAMIADPALATDMPNGATLILLPDDDRELADYNRALGERVQARGEIVYVKHVRADELIAFAAD